MSARVLVIGAGVAGLAAARELAARHVSVTVIESRDRAGGRVWTDRSLGTPIDLGASWIHGDAPTNPIAELATRQRILTARTDYDSAHLYAGSGEVVEPATTRQVNEAIGELIDELYAYGSSLGQDMSIQAGIDRILTRESLSKPERYQLDWTLANLVMIHGEQLDALSLRYADDEAEHGEYDSLFPGGYDQIVDALASGLDLALGEIVESVDTTGPEVVVATNRGVHVAERVIVTLPLGVLKAGTVRFAPALPAAKLEAIQQLGMGTLDKIALRFERPFWPAERHFIGVAASSVVYPTFMNWMFYTGEAVLLAFIGGDRARAMEARSDEEVTAEIMKVLRGLYRRAPEPIGVRVTRWNRDPFAAGSFSHVPLGATSALFDRLAAPVGDRLFFAGEATSRAHRSTVCGAFESGLRAARQLLSSIA